MTATFSAIKKILTLPCSEASLLMSDSLDRKLTLVERLALRGHFLACRTCPPALRQMRLVRTATRSLASAPENSAPETSSTETVKQPGAEKLSESARERIKRALRETGSDDSRT